MLIERLLPLSLWLRGSVFPGASRFLAAAGRPLTAAACGGGDECVGPSCGGGDCGAYPPAAAAAAAAGTVETVDSFVVHCVLLPSLPFLYSSL